MICIGNLGLIDFWNDSCAPTFTIVVRELGLKNNSINRFGQKLEEFIASLKVRNIWVAEDMPVKAGLLRMIQRNGRNGRHNCFVRVSLAQYESLRLGWTNNIPAIQGIFSGIGRVGKCSVWSKRYNHRSKSFTRASVGFRTKHCDDFSEILNETGIIEIFCGAVEESAVAL